jgi:hypothetical protein
MRCKLSAVLLILSCLPAAAQNLSPRLQHLVQGNGVTISGRAHVERHAEGTYIEIENPQLSRQIAGFVAFGNQSTFPGLYDLDGRDVEITGIVVLDGHAVIQMNDQRQLRVKDL